MPALAEKPVSPEQLRKASRNYLRCLNLPPSSQVLIITDKINGEKPNNDLLARAYMTSSLIEEIGKKTHRVAEVKFDDSLDFSKFREATLQKLKELEEMEGDGEINRTTTIIYLGEKWENRTGMYQAADEFGKEKKRIIRWAGSLGFSNGDARVMSELTPKRMETIYEANRMFNNFFKERPQGAFEIATRGPDGEERILNLTYDTKKAPFESDVGQFDEDNKVMMTKNVQYINIPGGEKFASPYPFRKTNGEFSAEGMLFTVKNGLVVSVVPLKDGVMEKKDPMQKKLVELIQRGETFPVSELGLGFYALAGIKTYTDCSILALEKGGPHIGFADAPGKTSEKKGLAQHSKIKNRREGEPASFHHTDFVMDNPVMMWSDLDGNDRQQFYPPPHIEERNQSGGPGTTDVK